MPSRNNLPEIGALIIHLERACNRKAQVSEIRRKSSLPAKVIAAVDGTQLDEAGILNRYQRHLYPPPYPFRLRNSEVGVFLSHRKCWQEIVDQDMDAAFIFEDDADVRDDLFEPALAMARRHLEPNDFIRFPASKREKPQLVVAEEGTARLFRPTVVGRGMVGQLVARTAAKTLLEKTARFDRPVDAVLQMTWLTGVRTLTVAPSGIEEISGGLGGSLIGQKNSLPDRLCREVLRPIYRMRVAACAARMRVP